MTQKPSTIVTRDNTAVTGKGLLRKKIFFEVKMHGGTGTVLNVFPGRDDEMGRVWRELGAEVIPLGDITKLPQTPPVDIYDVDTYSQPWPHFETILNSRSDRDFALIGTDAGMTWVRLNAKSHSGYRRGLTGVEKLPRNYESYILRRGYEMIGAPIKMFCIWNKLKSGAFYFGWLLGRYATK